MRNISMSLAVCSSLSFLLLATPASAKLALKGKPSAWFDARGPGGLKIEGKAKEMTLSDDGTSVTFTVPVAGVDTGIALRNKHMRDKYVHVDKNPDATLVVPRASLTIPDKDKVNGTVKGVWTLAGVPKDVVVSYSAEKDGDAYSVKGTFDMNVKDHGIEIPNYLGVTVDPKMTVNVEFKATDAQDASSTEAPAPKATDAAP